MATKEKEKEAAKKSWLESDERKKLLETISDEEERKAADEWDSADATKARIRRAREAYEKTADNGNTPHKPARRKFFGREEE
jgi:hypothetical protein